jgi:hypothetical protein
LKEDIVCLDYPSKSINTVRCGATTLLDGNCAVCGQKNRFTIERYHNFHSSIALFFFANTAKIMKKHQQQQQHSEKAKKKQGSELNNA